MFLVKLALHVPKDGMTTPQLYVLLLAHFNCNLPSSLHLQKPHSVAFQSIKDQHRLYNPRSDVLILQSALPRPLVEVDSSETKEWPPDLIRMLLHLQEAAIVRFANTFLDAFKEKDFVLVAICIWDNGKAARYTPFQKQMGNRYIVLCI
ncbi:hypothetical protein BJV78DRAFT_1281706 [Lactifluus subvellereus]|nr:hypothetical protein BJV78DRAFT_1281706 [Lactifluus subvellereus]